MILLITVSGLSVKPPVGTTSRYHRPPPPPPPQQPVSKNTKSFQVIPLYLAPLVSDHFSLATGTTFRAKVLHFIWLLTSGIKTT